MASRKIFKYKTKLFLIVNVFLWILALLFISIQYSREKEYKADEFNTALQVYNSIILKNIEQTGQVNEKFVRDLLPHKDYRLTVLDYDGNVLYESHATDSIGNHSNRAEIMEAIKDGEGHTLRRRSAVDSCDYFYSAKAGKDVIVRTAAPYSTGLVAMLSGDMAYVWIVIVVVIVINVILYFAISRLNVRVRMLQDIAHQAESNKIIDYDTASMPNDEFGEVSRSIVKIYNELRLAIVQRDMSIEEALYEEKEKLRIKNQLTSNINHELKTPVHAIRGCFETLLENENDLSEEVKSKLLQSGYANAMRLSDLLHDVALITQMTDAKESIETTPVNVLEVIKEVCAEVDDYSPERRMRINLDVPDNVVVKGSRQLIDAIFRNLVNNSLAYSGGRDIFIRLVEETPDKYVFDFYDNGAGVEDKHLERIFERFYRIDSGRSRKMGGTGLGLSIVRNSVLFHGGTIKAQNRMPSGLEFIFSLKKTN